MKSRHAQRCLILFFAAASPCFGVHWINSQTGPSTWTYTLQIDPEDNFNISQSSTTITMTGLSGVTSATGPTSSDFPNPLGAQLLNWTPQVLNGGTTVVWTITGGGTGNFPTTKHIFGFSITASSAANGTASVATSGFQVDSGGPNRDISGSVAGPTAAGSTPPPNPAGAPAASTVSLLITLAGLTGIAAYQGRKQLQNQIGN